LIFDYYDDTQAGENRSLATGVIKNAFKILSADAAL
jgi:hypothetical protein